MATKVSVLGVRRDTWLAAICRYALAVDYAFAILTAHGSGKYVFRTHGLNRMQNFALFITDGIGAKRNRRFHRGQADELHDVVRHHVAQGAGFVVISAALFHADSFRHRNLDVIDVTSVPDRLEDSVGKAESQNVLNGFFAQVVIDAVDLLFIGHPQQLLVQKPGGLEIMTERFFDDDAPPVLRLLAASGRLLQVVPPMVRKNPPRWPGNRYDFRGSNGPCRSCEQVFQLKVELLVAHIAAEVIDTTRRTRSQISGSTLSVANFWMSSDTLLR